MVKSMGLEMDEEALKRFRSMQPANCARDEDGTALPAAPAFEESTVLFADDEDDLEFVDE